MSRAQLGKYLWQLLVAIVPVPITIWLTVLYIQNRNEVRALEYTRTVREGFINLPSSLPSKVELTYGGTPVDNLSSVKYQLFNRTGRSFEDVKVFFEFRSHDGPTPQLLSKDIKGPEHYPGDGFKELEPRTSSAGWSLDAISSYDNLLDTFEVTFVFLGSKAPDVDIAVLKAGLDLEPLAPLEPSQISQVLRVVGAVVGLMLYVSFGVLFMRFARGRRSRFRDDLRSRLHEFFDESTTEPVAVDSASMANDVLAIYSRTLRDHADPVSELLLRLFMHTRKKLRGSRSADA